MFDDNRRRISDNYSRDDYLALNLRLSSSTYTWHQAIEMMRDRIIGRYLQPMDVLIKTDVKRNGFAAMALCSLLIETLYQFREGKSFTPSPNQDFYAGFLKTQMGDVFTTQLANRFYSDIRCGILHSAQTKKGSCLTFDTNYVVKIFGNGVLMVNVQRMNDAITQYFENYCKELLDVRNEELRTNFIKKMNDISKKWEGSNVIDNLWFAVCEKEDMVIERSNGRVFRFKVVADGTALKINNNIRLTKQEIGNALHYWPDESDIQMYFGNKASFIIPLLRLCRNVADDIIRREIA